MELIFGGAYQGKTQYAAQKYDLTDADIFTCEDLDLDPDAASAILNALRARARKRGSTRARNLRGARPVPAC